LPGIEDEYTQRCALAVKEDHRERDLGHQDLPREIHCDICLSVGARSGAPTPVLKRKAEGTTTEKHLKRMEDDRGQHKQSRIRRQFIKSCFVKIASEQYHVN
jgi:hypothetical protein